MRIKVDEAKVLANDALVKLGFSNEDTQLIIRNLIEAELVEKRTHGLIRIPALKKQLASDKVSKSPEPITLLNETNNSLHFDAKYKPGFVAIYQSLDKAIEKTKDSGIVAVALKDLAYASGYIGAYARLATENDLIFIGVNNSAGGLIPHGSIKELWGTNPLTIGVPTNDMPVILDMASSNITWGDLMVAKQEGKKLPTGVALNKAGQPTIDPVEAMDGGLLPFAGHKGSGLAFIIELLAGALTGSRVGYAVEGGWGSFYLLINPTMFRSIDDFRSDVTKAINELKAAPKANGVSEIYFAGEQSGLLRKQHVESGKIEVNDKLIDELKGIAHE